MNIKKLLLGLILFSALIFTQNVSADTPLLHGKTVKLQGTVLSTDISSSTVKFKTSNDNQKVTIKDVPDDVIDDINNQKDEFAISYKNTFTIYDEGSHKINNLETNTKNAYVSAYFNDFSSEKINNKGMILPLIAVSIIMVPALVFLNPMLKKNA